MLDFGHHTECKALPALWALRLVNLRLSFPSLTHRLYHTPQLWRVFTGGPAGRKFSKKWWSVDLFRVFSLINFWGFWRWGRGCKLRLGVKCPAGVWWEVVINSVESRRARRHRTRVSGSSKTSPTVEQVSSRGLSSGRPGDAIFSRPGVLGGLTRGFESIRPFFEPQISSHWGPRGNRAAAETPQPWPQIDWRFGPRSLSSLRLNQTEPRKI